MMDFFTVSIFFLPVWCTFKLHEWLSFCVISYLLYDKLFWCMNNFTVYGELLSCTMHFFYLMMDFLTMINLSSVWLTFYLQKSFLNVWWTFHLDAELFTCMINFLPVWTFELYNKLLLYGDFLMHEQFYSRMNFLTVLRTF